MAANMQVKTSEVLTAKNNIHRSADSLNSAYKQVFQHLQTIDNAWEGDDNTQFNERKNSFIHDFEKLDEFLVELELYLQSVKDEYERAEADTKRATERLAK